MTPADGSDYPQAERTWFTLGATRAILLHGGRTLLLFEGAPLCLPATGTLLQGGRVLPWRAKCWQVGSGEREEWCGLAVLEALPSGDAEIHDAVSARTWRFTQLPSVDVTPQPLADLVLKSGVDCRDVFDFLTRHLLESRAGPEAARAYQAFARSFFTAVAERDGFIEILALPECGGLFAQGWSMSLKAGPATLASVAGALSVREVEVATFEREDILAPGQGICFFSRDWRDVDLHSVDAVFYERDGRLHRLDVVRGSLLKLEGAPAVAHVRKMLGRLEAPEATHRAFRRICRPRFGGTNTLAETKLPVAAALDCLLQAPDGSLLAMGWLLDPMHRVELCILKSTGNLYARLEQTWCALPRPDLNTGFAADPRFADLLTAGSTMHGFIAHIPATRDKVDGSEVYLELVLDDESCLFRPVNVTPFTTTERLPQIVGAIHPNEPELARIVEDHLAPFLASVAPASKGKHLGKNLRLIPLAGRAAAREVSAIMPFRSMAELQPVLGVLAGSEEARRLELVLVTARATASEHLKKLEDAFRFYGLQGGMVITPDDCTVTGQLDAGVAVTSAPRVLCWLPSALPKAHGWLADLIGEAGKLPAAGLLSPALTYEDDSIYFGGARLADAGPEAACALSGYGSQWLRRGAPEMVASGAAEIALIDRALLEAAGGFTGHLFSDSFAHVDLAARLRRAGSGAWCTGAVEFWMLDEAHTAEGAPFARLMRQVDAALLGRRSSMETGGHRA